MSRDSSTNTTIPKSSSKKSNKLKMSITLPEEIAKHLEWLAEVQDISKVEAIRKAIATESFLKQELIKGAKVLVVEGDSTKEVVFR
ncbi:MAG: ribbon-helix-helix protein, CopG family [Cyanobacteria bacterium P01_F01_bin.143]